MRLRLAPFTFALTLLASAPAFAAEDSPKPYPECGAQPTDGDVAAAKGAFQAGQASFNEADYNRAITYWEDAYRRDCTAHALLLNLARAYELNDQKRMAVNALETFLSRNPSTPQRDQIARRIEVLNEKIAAEGPPTAGGGPQASDPSGPKQGDGSTTPNPTPDKGGEGGRPILPLIVAGGGGLVAVVGGVLFLGAKADEKDAEEACGGNRSNCSPEVEAQGDDAVKRANRAGLITIAGVAIAAGGVAWYFLSEPAPAATARKKSPLGPRISPAVAPGYAGLSFAGAF